jgi:hypothetical protein
MQLFDFYLFRRFLRLSDAVRTYPSCITLDEALAMLQVRRMRIRSYMKVSLQIDHKLLKLVLKKL